MAQIDLYNGDCLEVMQQLIDKNIKVDAVITDSPYGTSRCKWDRVISLEDMWNKIKLLRKLFCPIVLFCKEPFGSMLRCSNIEEYKYDWTWIKDTKSNFPQAPYQPLNNIENIAVFSDGYARYGNKKMPYYPQMIEKEEYKIPKSSKTTSIFAENYKNGVYKHKNRDTKFRYPYCILKFNTDKNRLHPTQKPVELMEYLVKTYTNENDIVLDPFMGSGTTGVACKNLNRNFIGIELDKTYFEIAKERINGSN